jgi:hypothetical protein
MINDELFPLKPLSFIEKEAYPPTEEQLLNQNVIINNQSIDL